MLFIEGLEDAQLQLPEGPGDDGIVIDGPGDRRQISSCGNAQFNV